MKPIVQVLIGSVLLLGGLLFALLETGVYFIADCSEACVARGERLVVVGLIALGVAIMAGGVVLIIKGGRRWRAA